MTGITFDTLQSFLSAERLGTYLQLTDSNKQKAADSYMENLGRCQIFYSSLHWLEIGLRNAMNKQLSLRFGNQWFDNYSVITGNIERQQIQKAKDTLIRDSKPLYNPDIIAAMNFGLWVNLYNKPYEELWRRCLVKVFPYHPGGLTRKRLREKLRPILKLRNRIAHYEPILSLNLTKFHQDIIDMVEWIEPNIKPAIHAL